MKQFSFLMVTCLVSIIVYCQDKKNNRVEKISITAVYTGEIREVDHLELMSVVSCLKKCHISNIKPGKSEILINIGTSEQWALLDFKINSINKLKKGDCLNLKGYRVLCSDAQSKLIINLIKRSMN